MTGRVPENRVFGYPNSIRGIDWTQVGHGFSLFSPNFFPYLMIFQREVYQSPKVLRKFENGASKARKSDIRVCHDPTYHYHYFPGKVRK